MSFHWTGVRRRPGSTLLDYQQALRELAAAVPVIGHAHPKVWTEAELFFRNLGIEPVRHFTDVIEQASVYACDHSSTIFEWAALDRPVILLERAESERLVPHPTGLRYQLHAELGPIATPSTLVDVARAALAGCDEHAAARLEATAELYPYLSKSRARALEVLRDVAAGTGR